MSAIQPSTDSDCKFVASRLFGPLNVPDDTCLMFPDGILGFAGERSFVLLPAAHDGVYWMQDVGDGNLALLVIDPFRFFPDYVADVADTDNRRIGATDESEVAVLAVVTLPRESDQPCTANLQGPIVLNFSARKGCQAILDDSGYGTKHSVDLRKVLSENNF